jgi:hypothetical protein
MEKDKIEFFAKVGNWVCIKRGDVKEGTTGPDITRVLTSIQNSIDRKKWEFLGDDLDLKYIDTIAHELVEGKGRVNADKLSEILAKVNGPGVGRKIKEVAKTKAAAEVAKTYLTRVVLDLLKFRIDLDSKLIEKFINQQEKLKQAD